jgi:tetratricopeptide (TPR) repeat protein
MIPDLYFQYVRGGRPEAMAAVFEHNRHDILSLIALTCRLGRLLDGSAADVAATAAATVPALRAVPPAVPVTAAESLPAVADLFAAARIYEDLGLLEEACSRYEQALAVRRDVALRARVATRLAAISKRVGRHERAVQLWRRLATLGLTGCEPFVELAKHYEHRAHDYDAAIQAVEEALAVVELQVLRRQVGAVSERAALHHRLARLVSKRDRQRGRSLSALA